MVLLRESFVVVNFPRRYILNSDRNSAINFHGLHFYPLKLTTNERSRMLSVIVKTVTVRAPCRKIVLRVNCKQGAQNVTNINKFFILS